MNNFRVNFLYILIIFLAAICSFNSTYASPFIVKSGEGAGKATGAENSTDANPIRTPAGPGYELLINQTAKTINIIAQTRNLIPKATPIWDVLNICNGFGGIPDLTETWGPYGKFDNSGQDANQYLKENPKAFPCTETGGVQNCRQTCVNNSDGSRTCTPLTITQNNSSYYTNSSGISFSNNYRKNILCPPFARYDGREGCLKQFRANDITPAIAMGLIHPLYYKVYCAEKVSDNSYDPKIRLRLQNCNDLFCYPITQDLDASSGQCTVLPGHSLIPLPTIRFCARIANRRIVPPQNNPNIITPDNITYEDDPGYTNYSLDENGFPIIDEGIVNRDGFRTFLPKVCLYEDPALGEFVSQLVMGLWYPFYMMTDDFLYRNSLPDGFDKNMYHQFLHKNQSVGGSSFANWLFGNSSKNEIVQSKFYFNYSAWPIQRSFPESTYKYKDPDPNDKNEIPGPGGKLKDAIANGVTNLSSLDKYIRAAKENYKDWARYQIVNKKDSLGCVTIKLGPFPPKFCIPIKPPSPLLVVEEICPTVVSPILSTDARYTAGKLYELNILKSTSDAPCVTDKTPDVRNNFITNSVRVGIDNFIPICNPRDQSESNSKQCVTFSNGTNVTEVIGGTKVTKVIDGIVTEVIDDKEVIISSFPPLNEIDSKYSNIVSYCNETNKDFCIYSGSLPTNPNNLLTNSKGNFRVAYKYQINSSQPAKVVNTFPSNINNGMYSKCSGDNIQYPCLEVYGVNNGNYETISITAPSSIPANGYVSSDEKTVANDSITLRAKGYLALNDSPGGNIEIPNVGKLDNNSICVSYIPVGTSTQSEFMAKCIKRADPPPVTFCQCGDTANCNNISCASTHNDPKAIAGFKYSAPNIDNKDTLHHSDSYFMQISPDRLNSSLTGTNIAGAPFIVFATDNTLKFPPFTAPTIGHAKQKNPFNTFGNYANKTAVITANSTVLPPLIPLYTSSGIDANSYYIGGVEYYTRPLPSVVDSTSSFVPQDTIYVRGGTKLCLKNNDVTKGCPYIRPVALKPTGNMDPSDPSLFYDYSQCVLAKRNNSDKIDCAFFEQQSLSDNCSNYDCASKSNEALVTSSLQNTASQPLTNYIDIKKCTLRNNVPCSSQSKSNCSDPTTCMRSNASYEPTTTACSSNDTLCSCKPFVKCYEPKSTFTDIKNPICATGKDTQDIMIPANKTTLTAKDYYNPNVVATGDCAPPAQPAPSTANNKYNTSKCTLRAKTLLEQGLCTDILPIGGCAAESAGNASWPAALIGQTSTGTCSQGFVPPTGGLGKRLCGIGFSINSGSAIPDSISLSPINTSTTCIGACGEITQASPSNGFATWSSALINGASTGTCSAGMVPIGPASMQRTCSLVSGIPTLEAVNETKGCKSGDIENGLVITGSSSRQTIISVYDREEDYDCCIEKSRPLRSTKYVYSYRMLSANKIRVTISNPGFLSNYDQFNEEYNKYTTFNNPKNSFGEPNGSEGQYVHRPLVWESGWEQRLLLRVNAFVNIEVPNGKKSSVSNISSYKAIGTGDVRIDNLANNHWYKIDHDNKFIRNEPGSVVNNSSGSTSSTINNLSGTMSSSKQYLLTTNTYSSVSNFSNSKRQVYRYAPDTKYIEFSLAKIEYGPNNNSGLLRYNSSNISNGSESFMQKFKIETYRNGAWEEIIARKMGVLMVFDLDLSTDETYTITAKP